MVPISLSAPLAGQLARGIDGLRPAAGDALVELIGVGWPPRHASTTNRWTVLLPTSSTPVARIQPNGSAGELCERIAVWRCRHRFHG